ncbi:hypothetical protein [Massilia sp. TS11]|uniref:hypothetical protein n=1 Tax=Massilia sp. TS11 TaxID=2908003 RepID=UPI001EDB7ED1|nr:hypothetical protein [Massilia sp. TS11]MCG2584833.1 hypothetical protein [Massilia sp. TS11]
MSAAPDPVRRLRAAVLLRRLPLWLGGLLPWLAVRAWAGAALWLLLAAADAWRQRQRLQRDWPRWLDAELAQMEDSSALLQQAATPIARLQQARLLARLDAALDHAATRTIARRHVGLGFGWLLASALLAATVWLAQQPRAAAVASAPGAVTARAPAGTLAVSVRPPAYTGVAASDGKPRDLQIPEQSLVRWCLNGAAPGTIALSDGQQLDPAGGCAEWTATESVFWRWQGQRYTIKVQPDLAPEIVVSAPGEMVQLLARDAKAARIAFSIRDDYQIMRATLHLTLARGSGENIRFSDKEVPIPAGPNPRQRAWDKQWALAELGMEPGDELYFFVRASDNAAKPHLVQSPTYTLRLPGPQAAENESSALPALAKPENLRSQRQIIIDTEQLLADIKANPKLGYPVIRARSEQIAADQALLKRRYGQFLGEESSLFGGGDDDDHGKGGDMLHQFGHAHDEAENATLFDENTKKVLRRALAAMWDAERELRAISPKTALAPEYKALEAIKELQQADRIYLHKTAFAPPAIKEEKRMTGEMNGARSYQRAQGTAGEIAPPEVTELIQALSADGALPALWQRAALDWIRAHLDQDEARLAAQQAVQDVADGCQPCRAGLRAWLRGGIGQAPVLLQPRSQAVSPFARAFEAARPPEKTR